MARVLILCESLPADSADGLHLRVQNLVDEIAEQHDCYLLYCGNPGTLPEYDGITAFREHASLPERPVGNRSWKRHFRISNANFLRLASPAYLDTIEARLSEVVAAWRIDLIVSFAASLGEAGDMLGIPRVLDYTDSRTLTLERMLSNPYSDMSFGTRMKRRLELLRVRGRERALVRRYDYTTTISGLDKDALLRVSKAPAGRVHVVPNGVSSAALAAGATLPDAGSRTVAFWGNLDFPPNRTAIRYFFRQIFLPYLVDKGIEWHIAGRLKDDGLRREMDHPQIHFHGFVDDLFAFVRRHGVMVNPMVEGSGLKNKVLEAFALGIPVVSTPLGIEAIDCTAGSHYLPGTTPKAFSDAVIRLLDDPSTRSGIAEQARALVEARYSWSAVGADYRAFLHSVLEGAGSDRVEAISKQELRYESR